MKIFHPETVLERRKEKLQNKELNLNLFLRKISRIRLGIFISCVVYFSILYFSRTENFLYQVGLLPLTGIFFYYVFLFQKIKKYRNRLASYLEVIKKELCRARLDFKNLNNNTDWKNFPNNIYQKDLDIFGDSGLFLYLDTTQTVEGEKKLLESLLCIKDRSESEILERQNRIRKLTLEKTLTLKYLRLWRDIEKKENHTKVKLTDLNKSRNFFFENRKFLQISYKILCILFISSAFVNFVFNISIFTSSLFFFQFSLFVFFRSKLLNHFKPYYNVSEKIKTIEKVLTFLIRKNISLNILEKYSFDEKEIKKSFHSLFKIMNKVSIVHSPSTHFLLNILFLWDFWLIDQLDNWQKKYSESLKIWSDTIIYLDSILPFSHFHFHNPENNFPQISDSYESISAKKMSHPLIPKSKRVQNDLAEIHFGEIDLITGSNMSGKTTYLRTIGINSVLALCGSSVPAENFCLPPISILTSIRNEDSLIDGISFFYAEVKKISSILKSLNKNKKSLVLLDELLKGTNSRERFIATTGILKKLQEYRSISFVTTHDTELANNFSGLHLHHFSEIIEDGKMNFDYKIKGGVVKSGNALKILEFEGLDLEFSQ
ncbi:MAG: DNA mismatch repair protein [Leptospiraceae bacterium]|nr:DNA mismatch repair protein [Leptospiraceae bacterium]MCK6380370.1 DNA mismatch repair protein [Leptospiraceae bacterium]NUM41293.1 DNA mismatch repair protein [Leptospiraceae bacterium]